MKDALYVIWFGIAIAAFLSFIRTDWYSPIDYFINTAKLSFYILLFLAFISLPYLIYVYV